MNNLRYNFQKVAYRCIFYASMRKSGFCYKKVKSKSLYAHWVYLVRVKISNTPMIYGFDANWSKQNRWFILCCFFWYFCFVFYFLFKWNKKYILNWLQCLWKYLKIHIAFIEAKEEWRRNKYSVLFELLSWKWGGITTTACFSICY